LIQWFQPAPLPPNSVQKLWVTVDIDGGVLEKIAAGGPAKLFGP
jgi:hypothetical protein